MGTVLDHIEIKNMIYNYPHPFFRFVNTSAPVYKQEEKDDKITIEIQLPGVAKEEIAIKYNSESRHINVTVPEKIDQSIYLYRQINPDGIKAKLDLGVLTITAPILNTDRDIKID